MHQNIVVDEDSDDGQVVVGVALSRVASTILTVDVATSDGTATAGEDYTATTETVTIAAGERSARVTVPIIDDSIHEDNETFTVTLSNPSGGEDAVSGDEPSSDVTIISDDPVPPPVVSVEGPADAVLEDDASYAVFTITLSKSWGRIVYVDVVTSDGTATVGWTRPVKNRSSAVLSPQGASWGPQRWRSGFVNLAAKVWSFACPM